MPSRRKREFILRGLAISAFVAAALAYFGYVAFDVTDPAVPNTHVSRADPSTGAAAGTRTDTQTGLGGPGATSDVRAPPNAAWRLVSIGDIDPNRIPSQPDAIEAAVLVALADEMRYWREGDTVSLPVPQLGETFTPVIDRVETLIGTSRSYTGRIDDNPPLSFVVTVSERNTFALIATRSGIYELVGNASFGWLMPATGLREHFDNGQPDVIVPH